MHNNTSDALQRFLEQIPSIVHVAGVETNEAGMWSVKFRIDIQHPLAWHVVQELGHVANCLSVNERLPTAFYPVSPPPYSNGGPLEFLSWVLENKHPDFKPADMKEWLEGRLPQPVNDESEWVTDDEDVE
ncbi:hypothetical protein [Hymenobacter sp. 102]|uniref:hypothetical protein n=1 Tax=Hymenobacter sp. 102 TaxID=3403152 RepID=UPI003CF835D7